MTNISVGIMSAKTIHFSLMGGYGFVGKSYEGDFCATVADGRVLFDGRQYDELLFEGGSRFTLRDVTIGVNFHWQRREDQTFKGALRIIAGNDHVLSDEAGLIAINIVDIEDYLASVISSEMSATSSLELLKAHAVISRSWVLHPIMRAQMSHEGCNCNHANCNAETPTQPDDKELHIRWYERDAHRLFDVCADDHCQRYQGITRQTSEDVQKAIDATRGEVLISEDNSEICDARFYKSCGGATELFENCWADEPHPYLQAIRDAENEPLPDLTDEHEAREWILNPPPSFCDTQDKRILSQVLNNYDQETPDFYRWTVEYTQAELNSIVRERSGIDFGTIEDLIPVRRGPSGRIIELRIIGTKCTMVVGKELEIRKWLSRSHLYSSAFVVEKREADPNKQVLEKITTTPDNLKQEKQARPCVFVLHGAGWGHGVGLCQIGAAVMADQGYQYKEILAHYFPRTIVRS